MTEFFIDTLDNAEAMERADPTGAKGMIAAAATLLAAVRARYPAMRIMLNRGYAVLPQAADRIDYLLAEAMATRWSFAEPALRAAERVRLAMAGGPAARGEGGEPAAPGARDARSSGSGRRQDGGGVVCARAGGGVPAVRRDAGARPPVCGAAAVMRGQMAAAVPITAGVAMLATAWLLLPGRAEVTAAIRAAPPAPVSRTVARSRPPSRLLRPPASPRGRARRCGGAGGGDGTAGGGGGDGVDAAGRAGPEGRGRLPVALAYLAARPDGEAPTTWRLRIDLLVATGRRAEAERLLATAAQAASGSRRRTSWQPAMRSTGRS
ncbi:hypothetical protein AB5I41_06865 [Sphingomonas sp. MMS24-JH45]